MSLTRRFLQRLCFGLAASLTAIFALACGDRPPKASSPRLVVLYVTCSLNKDYLSPYNPEVRYTPNLDKFAREGQIFQKHQTETGVSGPGFASIFTGTHADRHKIYSHPERLTEDMYLISEAFLDNGYETFFWSGHPMASASLGYGQGIPPANVILTEGSGTPAEHARLTGNDGRFLAILQKLEHDPDYKAYLQFTFTLTHNPYHLRTTAQTQKSFAERYPEYFTGFDPKDVDRLLAIYSNNTAQLTWNFPETAKRLELSDKDVQQLSALLEFFYRVASYELDRQFGAFIKKIHEAGLDDQTLVVVTTDHGEILYRENAYFKWTHGKQLSPEVFNVPLIIWSPGARVSSGVYDRVTRSVDVFPTMAGLCGLTLPEKFVLPGYDLSPTLRGEASGPKLLSYSHTSILSIQEHNRSRDLQLRRTLHPRPDPALMWTMIREGDLVYKLQRVRQGEWQTYVFDWKQDRSETRDLFDAADPHHQQMAKRLLAYRRQLVAAYPDVDSVLGRLSDAEKLERLRSLGYIN